MTTMPAAADVNLDELKKKARRRLVGACVLALAAAVFVPMLLESDERPLGDDISVKIPPVDPGKFVNRLNSAPASGKNAPKDSQARPGAPAMKGGDAPADAKTSSSGDASEMPAAGTVGSAGAAAVNVNADKAGATSKSLGDAERRVLGSTSSGAVSAAAPTSASNSASAPASASTAGSPSASNPAPAPAAASSSAAAAKPDESKSAASAADTKKAAATPGADARKSPAASAADAKKSAASSSADAKKTASTASRSTRGEFVVQLAAFSDDKGANALANRLKRSGHPAFTEPVNTSRGTLWRVRVGPYASRDEANAARDKLKREGQDGIVAARS